MSDSRIIQIRKSDTANASDLQYPFLFIQKQFGYPVENILRSVQTMSHVHLGDYPDTFPNTIQEFFWTQKGSPGSSMWIALGQLTSGMYFLYTAQTSNTPKTFLDTGHMNLWVSIQFSDLIHYAMDRVIYMKYLEETTE